MTNATLEKFGYPRTLLAEYEHWCVLLRPVQVTLGALILGCRGETRSFSAMPQDAFHELGLVIRQIERGLQGFRRFDKINYLMLMMVDPHVHFHVLPRYAQPQDHAGLRFADAGWPGAPDLGSGVRLEAETAHSLSAALKRAWPAA